MTAAEACELTAFLAVHVERQDAADSIVRALEAHMLGRRIAAACQAEREERARVDAHYGRLVASTKCADCAANCGEFPCEQHNLNAGDL